MRVSEVSELPGTVDLPEARYLDREESWLRFNQPVLELDEKVSLVERSRLLAIFAKSLDEFFMAYVRKLLAGRTVTAVIGDGALTGALAQEALNNIAASPYGRLVVVVNENGRS